jgi:cation:H+ antiporter
MGQATYFLLFGLGLAMIIKGSDWFIDSVIWIASVFKIPHIIIGATIVSICTTLPETLVAVTAAAKGVTDIAFGNAIGSIAINTGVVLAMLIVFSRPRIENRTSFIRNGVSLIVVIVFTWILGLLYGEISRMAGVILVALLTYFIVSNYMQAKNIMRTRAIDSNEEEINTSRKNILRKIVLFSIGISLVIVGSNLLVDNGIEIAQILGVPPLVIAIVFTSLGTSLPELVTAIASIRKKVTGLGVGNIIGANILNIVQAIGIASLVRPIDLAGDPSILLFQFPLTLAIVSCAVVFGVASRRGYQRWHGVLIFGLYIVFLIVNLLRESTPILGPLLF